MQPAIVKRLEISPIIFLNTVVNVICIAGALTIVVFINDVIKYKYGVVFVGLASSSLVIFKAVYWYTRAVQQLEGLINVDPLKSPVKGHCIRF